MTNYGSHAIISVLIQIAHFEERSFCMIVIDYHDKRPIYEQVIDRFQMLILNGALEPDEQLPSVRSLAIHWNRVLPILR